MVFEGIPFQDDERDHRESKDAVALSEGLRRFPSWKHQASSLRKAKQPQLCKLDTCRSLVSVLQIPTPTTLLRHLNIG